MEFRRDGDVRLMEEAPYRRMQELSDKWAASFEKGGEELTDAENTELEALQEQYVDRVWEEKYELQDFLKHDDLYRLWLLLAEGWRDCDEQRPDRCAGKNAHS